MGTSGVNFTSAATDGNGMNGSGSGGGSGGSNGGPTLNRSGGSGRDRAALAGGSGKTARGDGEVLITSDEGNGVGSSTFGTDNWKRTGDGSRPVMIDLHDGAHPMGIKKKTKLLESAKGKQTRDAKVACSLTLVSKSMERASEARYLM